MMAANIEKIESLLAQMLFEKTVLPEEKIVHIINGLGGVVFVASEVRVFILKVGGIATNRLVGQSVKTIFYKDITGIEHDHLQATIWVHEQGYIRKKGILYNVFRDSNAFLYGAKKVNNMNDLLLFLHQKVSTVNSGSLGEKSGVDKIEAMDLIKKLDELKASGLITEAEFNEKRKKLIDLI